MIIFYDSNLVVTGYQSYPDKSSAAHIVMDVSADEAESLIGSVVDSDLVDRANGDYEKIRAREAAELLRIEKKAERDAALQAMTYDFGDGRVMQTRPQDEANIIAAIDLIESEGIISVGWVMADNTKHAVTADELRAALRSGRLQGLAIWNEYNP